MEKNVARRLFTSESVTEGHPDKMADQISDAILDAMIKDDAGSRVAVETLITTGQVHVAGEVTHEDLRGHPRHHQGEDPADRLRLLGQGLRRGVLRRVCVHRVAVAGHRPGRDGRVRVPRGRGHRRLRPAGGGRPGPDVRLRLPGDPRADAAADHDGAPAGSPAVRGAPLRHRSLPAAGRQDPGDHRVRGRPAGAAGHRGRLHPARPGHRPEGTARAGRQGPRGRAGAGRASGSTPPATGCWSTRPGGSRSAARWATPASPAARSSSTPTAAWPGTAAAPSPARTRRRWTAAPPTRCGGWPRTWWPPSWPTAARRRSRTRSARPSRSASSSSASAPSGCRWSGSRTRCSEVFDLRPRAIIASLDLLRPIYSQTAAYGHFGRYEPDFSWERTDRAAQLRAAAGL